MKRKALPCPANFDTDVSMIGRQENTGRFHASRLSAEFAAQLVTNGTSEDLALAERVLAAVLACQERHPDDPHCGNFRWEREDEVIEDLNAVHFVLIHLCPMMLSYRDRISEATQTAVLEVIRLALTEIERIDVGLEYTNIALKDVTNTFLGAALLGDYQVQDRGRNKFQEWLRFTARSGGVYELNSPAYTPIALNVLHTLSTHTTDREVAVQARGAAMRLGLSYALRIHPETGRLAGPYSRAYLYQVLGQTGTEMDFLEKAVAKGILPGWILDVPHALAHPAPIVEGRDVDRAHCYTTWMSDSYTLGTATQEMDSQANRFIAGQSNVFTMHFCSKRHDSGGVIYSRYILDDKWVGDFRTATARPDRELLLDEGRFIGVQDLSRMIGVYAPRGLDAWQRHSSAKLALIVSEYADVQEILVDKQTVRSLPMDVPVGAILCLDLGRSLLAIRPFSCTDLGCDSPIRLVEREGNLVFEIYNYLGPAKTFWELANPGSFYQGQPRCAFYAEAVERSTVSSAEAFSEWLSSGSFIDQVEEISESNRMDRKRAWTLAYSRDNRELGLSVDLMAWRLLKRWKGTEDSPYRLLDCPVAKQSQGEVIEVAGAKLHAHPGSLWLYGDENQQTWVLGGWADGKNDIILELPDRSLRIQNFRFGTLQVTGNEVSLDTNSETTATSF